MKTILKITKNEIDILIKDIIKMLSNYKEVQTIILFGSYARGDYSIRHSDIDLYILFNGMKNYKLERELWVKTNKISKQIQIHLNFEYENLLEEGSLLRYNILKEGKVLYEKSKSIFLKKDFDLVEVLLIKLNLKNLMPNQKSNLKRSMLNKYCKNTINYSGNQIIILSDFLDVFKEISINKNFTFEILTEFLYREKQDFDGIEN